MFNVKSAEVISQSLGINPKEHGISYNALARGMNVELEHGHKLGKFTNITNDDPTLTYKIAYAHLYYTKLKTIEGGKISTIQSVIFNKKYYDRKKAEHFLDKYTLIPIKEHETEKYLRYRQTAPDIQSNYYTMPIKKGVKFIMMSNHPQN
jgi:hypothetical protein